MEIQKLCPRCMQEIRGNLGLYCPYCGRQLAADAAAPYHLKAHTVLAGNYVIGDVTEEDAFSITYTGYDMKHAHKVAVREFFPREYVTRDAAATRDMTAGMAQQELVAAWKMQYRQDADRIVEWAKVHNISDITGYFEENQTIYLIMQPVRGQTLSSYLGQHGGQVALPWLLNKLEPVMSGLQALHQRGGFHGDISPEHVLVTEDGRLVLTGFDLAAGYVREAGRISAVWVKREYAPAEWYQKNGTLGPQTDVYALAATIYKSITGVMPPLSTLRLQQDELRRPDECGAGLSSIQERALLHAMSVFADNRCQTMEEFRNEISGAVQMHPEPVVQPMPVNPEPGQTEVLTPQMNPEPVVQPMPGQPEMEQAGMQPGRKKGPVVALVLVLVLLAAVLCVLLVLVVGKGFKQTQTTAEEPKTERTERLREADTETEQQEENSEAAAEQAANTEQLKSYAQSLPVCDPEGKMIYYDGSYLKDEPALEGVIFSDVFDFDGDGADELVALYMGKAENLDNDLSGGYTLDVVVYEGTDGNVAEQARVRALENWADAAGDYSTLRIFLKDDRYLVLDTQSSTYFVEADGTTVDDHIYSYDGTSLQEQGVLQTAGSDLYDTMMNTPYIEQLREIGLDRAADVMQSRGNISLACADAGMTCLGKIFLQPSMTWEIANERYPDTDNSYPVFYAAFHKYFSGENDYILPDSATRALTEEELSGLTKDQLALARNEIFARYGYQFENAQLQNYFDQKSWYTAFGGAEETMLTETERQNLQLIQAKEAEAEDDLFTKFLNDEATASIYEEELSYSDLTAQYDIGAVYYYDVDNDGQRELLLGSYDLYPMMILDESDGKISVLTAGEGTAGYLFVSVVGGEAWICHCDISHMGRQIYDFEKYNGGGNVVDSFELSAEYWENENDFYDENSTFTYRDNSITMQEFEELVAKYTANNSNLWLAF